MMEPLTSEVPLMVIEGNHELEPQINNESFVAYKTRFAVPSTESNSGTSMYYSFNVGGIHIVMLGAYVDFNKSSKSEFVLNVAPCGQVEIWLEWVL